MVFLGLVCLSVASLCLLAFFDMFLYRQSFLESVLRLLAENVQLQKGSWLLVAAAYLCAAWHDLANWPALRRRKADMPAGRRKDEP